MKQDNRLTYTAIGVAAVLLVVGFVFSARIESGISHASQQEMSQHAAVTAPANAKAASRG